MKKTHIKQRDYNILLIIKGEINAKPKVIRDKKKYSRKLKHRKRFLE